MWRPPREIENVVDMGRGNSYCSPYTVYRPEFVKNDTSGIRDALFDVYECRDDRGSRLNVIGT